MGKLTPWVPMNDHLRRLHLGRGFFVDHHRKAALRWNRNNPYELWESGAGAFIRTRDGAGYSIAALRGTFRTQAAAIAQATGVGAS